MSKQIIYKTPQQIANIKEAGKYLTELLALMRDMAQPGIALSELEASAQAFIDQHKLTGSFKGYNGFPANLCLSVNNCVVHGIPDETILQPGDLLKIDAGITYKKGIADSAISMIVGGSQRNPEGAMLITVTKEALDYGLTFIKPGAPIYNYSYAVYQTVTKHGFSVIKNLTGHGVGTSVHEGPSIYNRPHPDLQGIYFRPGMVIALEPITAQQSDSFVQDKINGWNIYTAQGDLGAQWEYTVIITDHGYEIVAGISEIYQ